MSKNSKKLPPNHLRFEQPKEDQARSAGWIKIPDYNEKLLVISYLSLMN